MTVADTASTSDVHARLSKHILADGLPFVLDLERSHGPYLVDRVTGREILDLFMCYATCPVGYNHPVLHDPAFTARILPAALNKPSNSDFYTEEMADFVDALARTLPPELNERMFFISGGALAVENALKTAFDWKMRKNLAKGRGAKGRQIIHLKDAFHGRSGYTLSLTNTDPAKTDYFPKFDWPRVTNPRLEFPLTDEVPGRVAAAERESLEQIKQALLENPDDIAGLVLEPIQGEGGDNHFRPEYFQALRELADEEDFLLIFDEVQTGFGATGAWWCLEHFGVMPDVVAFGKKTQVCGICATERVDEVDSVFQVSSRINSTWGGNLVDMIRCERYIQIIEAEGLIAHAASVGDYFVRRLGEAAGSSPLAMTNVRGRGTFVAFDLPDTETREALLAAMVDAGLLGLRSGPRGIRFRGPLDLTEQHVDDAVERLGKAARAVAA